MTLHWIHPGTRIDLKDLVYPVSRIRKEDDVLYHRDRLFFITMDRS